MPQLFLASQIFIFFVRLSGIEHSEDSHTGFQRLIWAPFKWNRLFIDEILGLHKIIDMFLKFLLGVFQKNVVNLSKESKGAQLFLKQRTEVNACSMNSQCKNHEIIC